MITINISKCHCDVVCEAIHEAIPHARAEGIMVDEVLKMIQNPPLWDEHTVHISIDEDLWNTILLVLSHHPQPDVGKFFIHHLKELEEDAQLGYNE